MIKQCYLLKEVARWCLVHFIASFSLTRIAQRCIVENLHWTNAVCVCVHTAIPPSVMFDYRSFNIVSENEGAVVPFSNVIIALFSVLLARKPNDYRRFHDFSHTLYWVPKCAEIKKKTTSPTGSFVSIANLPLCIIARGDDDGVFFS